MSDITRGNISVDKGGVPGCEERVVTCTSREPANSDYCGAAEAFMMCVDKIVHDKVRGIRLGVMRPVRPR